MLLTKIMIKELLENKITIQFGCSVEDASARQIYEGLIEVVNDVLGENRAKSLKAQKDTKKVYYMSMEFLVGRSLKNNLYNLGIEKDVAEILKKMGIDLEDIYNLEPDAGLGNGGLGRLASCYLDGLTTLDYPATGFSIRYEYGIFKQEIIDDKQVEFPDNWLKMGAKWLVTREDEYMEVLFDGEVHEEWTENGLKTIHSNYDTVIAVPHDLYISGHKTNNVNTLRLWSAQTENSFDLGLFSKGQYDKAAAKKNITEAISKVLYPADDNIEGKNLRLRQQYFFVSASLQTILRNHMKEFKTLDNLADKVIIHINDTHPALCVPELMRLLMDEYEYNWDDAYSITCKTLAYTNHTIMQEALEKWPVDLFKARLPRIFSIVKEINRRFCEFVYKEHHDKLDKLSSLAIIDGGMVKMANMCVICCFSVNGVSKLHSDILKNKLFKDYNDIFAGKLTNVTNGITHRRWLCQSNPLLSNYLEELLHTNFEEDLEKIEGLNKFADDKNVLDKLFDIKYQNKVRLAKYIAENNGIIVNPSSIFDVQVKRLHEYKRQLLNALNIYYLYRKIKYEHMIIEPRTFIFAAKASAGYVMAKEIIYFINSLAEMVNNDPYVRDFIKVVFIADYKVSLAEIIMPAADISEQISQAGMEASGTGNMKLMINGAVTVGTMDGANIEIYDAVGKDNIFIFGMDAKQVNDLYISDYKSRWYYENIPDLKVLIDGMKNKEVAGRDFSYIADYLITNDRYMSLADFESYRDIQKVVNDTYADKYKWSNMSLKNIANSAIFTSDRSVEDYANGIWHISPLKNIK
ncbi:MAG: glycogen/starch/alpha-glucan phosphorylase [Clostridia bacterium]